MKACLLPFFVLTLQVATAVTVIHEDFEDDTTGSLPVIDTGNTGSGYGTQQNTLAVAANPSTTGNASAKVLSGGGAAGSSNSIPALFADGAQPIHGLRVSFDFRNDGGSNTADGIRIGLLGDANGNRDSFMRNDREGLIRLDAIDQTASNFGAGVWQRFSGTFTSNGTPGSYQLAWTVTNLVSSSSVGGTQTVAIATTGFGSNGTAARGLYLEIFEGDAVSNNFTGSVDNLHVTAVRSEKPNIVVILLDDMGWSDLGCYGSEIRTPTIDGLATNGLKYRHFYNTARCSTTRCALLTGLYTQQVAVDPGASLPNLKATNNVTIAELLSTSGYRRYMAGKWHVGTSNTQSPIGRGFQHIFGLVGGGNAPHNRVSGANLESFWDPANFGFYSENDEIAELDFSGTQFHQTEGIGDYSVAFINHHLAKNDSAPFFLYLPFNAIHWDINSPAAMADRYTDVGDPNPEDVDYYRYEDGWEATRQARFDRQLALGVTNASYTLSPKSPAINSNGTNSPTPPLVDIPAWSSLGADRRADLARRMALYAAMLEQVDNNIRKLTEHLAARGLLENTAIFLMADNGGNYEGGLYGKTDGTSNAAPITGFNNLRNMGQPSNPDLHIGGGWANVTNTPFRLYKHYQHEGGIATPLIVHWPAGITSPGRWVEDRGHLIDIFATISDITGTPLPTSWPNRTLLPIEGVSLKPHFRPETVAQFPVRPLGFEHESNRAWYEGDYKMVTKNFAYLDGSSPADEIELYHLPTDPTEQNNLAAQQPERAAQMVAAWNAWATRVGVPSDRLLSGALPPQLDPPVLPGDLFTDTFNRPNNTNHGAVATGMGGSLVPPLGAGNAWFNSFEAGQTEISDGALGIAVGTAGMSETATRHNFIDAGILAAGGFSVSLEVKEIDSASTDMLNRYAGIGVGLNAAEAQAGADISKTTTPFSFRGKDGNPVGTADFFIELDLAGNVKTFTHGLLTSTTAVGKTSGSLLACYECSSFALGATVTVSAYLDGMPVDLNPAGAGSTRSFTWRHADSNHIGLSARASNQAMVDNFAVRTLPASTALAAEHALTAGLGGANAAPDSDPDGDGDDNFSEWLKNGAPNSSDAGSKLLALAPAADGEFRFNYVHRNDAAALGLTYTFRCSSDLTSDSATWETFTPELVSSQPAGAQHEIRLVRVPSSLRSTRERLFILLEVE